MKLLKVLKKRLKTLNKYGVVISPEKFTYEDILRMLEDVKQQQEILIDIIIKLYEINKDMHKAVAMHNEKSKEKLSFNFLDLMHRLSLEKKFTDITSIKLDEITDNEEEG